MAVCFKSSALPLLYSPEQHRWRCPLHPWTFPSRECGGVLSVPEKQKRVGQWWGCLLPLCPSRNASSGLWWADRGRLMCWDSFTVPVQQMTQQRTQWGVRALDCTPEILRSYRITGRQPVGPVAFFQGSRSVGSLLAVALRSRSPAPPPNRGLENPARVAVDPSLTTWDLGSIDH